MQANIWFAEPLPDVDLCHGSGLQADGGTPCSGCSWCEPPSDHPGGYVVEVGGSQWDTGFKTLEEAHAFALAKGATSVYISGGVPAKWAGRADGDEGKW